jgi:hypothetical protein
MAGSVNNIDLVSAMMNREVFGKNRYAALFFEIIGVHDSFGDCFVCSEYPGMFQHCIDQRGLAMINMGDDGDVTD